MTIVGTLSMLLKKILSWNEDFTILTQKSHYQIVRTTEG
jgi:hypothetical protein